MVRLATIQLITPDMVGFAQIIVFNFVVLPRFALVIGRLLVFAIVIVIIAEFWGIDLTNLTAVGVQAVGFGVQKLIADIVSGVFILVDDVFRTGEYVEIDGTMGTVEKIRPALCNCAIIAG